MGWLLSQVMTSSLRDLDWILRLYFEHETRSARYIVVLWALQIIGMRVRLCQPRALAPPLAPRLLISGIAVDPTVAHPAWDSECKAHGCFDDHPISRLASAPPPPPPSPLSPPSPPPSPPSRPPPFFLAVCGTARRPTTSAGGMFFF